MTKTTTSVQTSTLTATDTTSTDTATPPVISLDFDGVLVQDSGWCPEAMSELNPLCLETGAVVALVTSFAS